MKRQLFAFIFAISLSVVLNTGQTFAQSTVGICAEIPFAFMANNKTLPAGTYRLVAATDNRSIWRIENRAGHANEFLLAGVLAGNRKQDMIQMTFHRYGETNFLVGFRTSSYEVALPRSKGEKALLARQMPTNVVSIDAAAEGSR
jgi:hypothetical protein